VEPTSQQVQQSQTPPTPAANLPVDVDAIRKQVVDELFEGKYKGDFTAAKQGVWNLTNSSAEAYRLLQEYRDNGVQVQQPTGRPDPLERLTKEAYIPADAFTEAVQRIVNQSVEQAFKPLTGAMEARNVLASEAPEYLQNEQGILTWLAANPRLSAEVQQLNDLGQYTAAAKYALLNWKASGKAVSAPGSPELKQQAALPNGNVSQPGNPVLNDPSLMEQALRYGHITGDKRPAYSMLFPDFEPILPPHLQQQATGR
jgi:hypothetical protein